MTPYIVVSPQRPSLDTELRVRLGGLPPHRDVTVRATHRDQRGRRWASAARYPTDAGGRLDLHQDAPVSGSYTGTDPMGLIWSMEPLDEPDPGAPVDVLAPNPLTLTAEVDGVEVASTTVERLRIPDGLARTEVRDGGLVGVLYHPQAGGRRPGVLMLGGSEGGLHEDDAALLAAHGYAVLALAYYGLPGLSPTLRDVPVEYFGRGLDVLRAHPRVEADRLAVTGGSKGGEAALLIAATYPHVRAAVSVVGSGVLTQGISQDIVTGSFLDIVRTPVPNWTWQGRPLPYLPNVATPELEKRIEAGEPVGLRMVFQPGLELADQLAEATIPVERIAGTVLLVSTEDDQGCGVEFHEIAARRLGDRCTHVVYPGAGHFICPPPYGPTTQILYPGPGVTFTAGGTPEATARARAGAWQETLAFLATHLAA
jgi:dienelactone hydrolase